jgi:hypothetical protein
MTDPLAAAIDRAEAADHWFSTFVGRKWQYSAVWWGAAPPRPHRVMLPLDWPDWGDR